MMRSGWKQWRKKKGHTPSQTPGKQKGENCQTDPRKKFFASNPKARNHPQYGEWHEKFKKLNLGAKSG